MLKSKVFWGVKCVEKESELGCKVYHTTLKQTVPKEQSVQESKKKFSPQGLLCKFKKVDIRIHTFSRLGFIKGLLKATKGAKVL